MNRRRKGIALTEKLNVENLYGFYYIMKTGLLKSRNMKLLRLTEKKVTIQLQVLNGKFLFPFEKLNCRVTWYLSKLKNIDRAANDEKYIILYF